ncbi:protein SPEAR3-like [Gastrolobium bilobum]|uniref:protein SPEAR3-like n=1 Tax=Gastrolobium bilobum TaxID=150636 RepID=UPI002AB13804|nr:protein SPEAR3-like [Gastrolobium bilobum]
MGSNYFGEPNLGNERGGSGSSSSRKAGKKNNSDKPKQPQRGLGVAQLEKIRLHDQIASAYHPSLHGPYPPNFNNLEDPTVQNIAYSSVPSSSFSYSSSSTTSYSASYGFQPHIKMGLSEYEKTNISYGDSQPTNTARWDYATAILENQISAQSSIIGPFLNLHDSQDIDTEKHRSGSPDSSSQNFESSDTQELDLELRLSLGSATRK